MLEVFPVGKENERMGILYLIKKLNNDICDKYVYPSLCVSVGSKVK